MRESAMVTIKRGRTPNKKVELSNKVRFIEQLKWFYISQRTE